MNELTDCEIETLREDGEFVVSRVKRAVGLSPCLLVAPVSERPPPASLAKLEQALALREELDAAWATLPVELVKYEGKLSLLLHDSGGEILPDLLGRPLALGQGLRIAIGIANALAHFHARELIHGDLRPGNVLVNPATGEAWLTGFGLTSRLPRHRPSPEPPEVLAGTLAYMAPEQTGRMNRSVDSRSDLYSLGVTLYEIFVGELPFTASDPMEWVHCQIARLPPAPKAKVPEIPEPISAIIMKLMAKAPEERYHTAAGVEADLRHCLAALEFHGRIDPFPLAVNDVPDRLLIPEKLYGREREIEVLLSAFDRVVSNGRAELVLVSGYSGVGKSSVVNELHKVLVPPRGNFASGKFDQYKRDIPYATLAQAFQQLVRQTLGKSDAEVARWRETFLGALGANGQLVVNLIPELELIIGRQPPVSALPPQDEQRRFQAVFRRFLGAFARPEHPLALFLDDLQWLDAATLDLLRDLITHGEIRHLLLIGAYRDNEVAPSHPLMRTLAEIGKSGAPVHQLMLESLNLDEVTRMVADAVHGTPEHAQSLAQLVREKTGGNPFFAIQFISTLAEGELLVFAPAAGRWVWEIDQIRAKGFTENVVDLMLVKLSRFAVAAQNVLKQLACLGNSAPTRTLIALSEESEETLHEALWEPVRTGLITRSEEAYSFIHDRVQEAAYALIPADERPAAHLRIGRALTSHMTEAEIEANIFEIVNQLNRGAALIPSQADRDRVAELNLMAGRRARSSTAYGSALVYLSAAGALLSADSWDRIYPFTFALKLQHAECELLTANFEAAEQLIAELLQRAKTKVDSAAVYRLKIELHLIQSKNNLAVESALEGLRLFDLRLSAHPDRAALDAAFQAVWHELAGREIESLIDLARVTDPDTEATLEILCVLYAPAFFTDENLTGLHICHTIRLTLEHGMTGASAHAFGLFGIMIGHFYGRYAEGFRFAQLAVDLCRKHRLFACEAKIFKAMEEASIWTHPIAFALDSIRASFRSANQSGDIPVACYACNHIVSDLLLRGDHLDDVWDETERGLAFVREVKFRDLVDTVVSQQRFVQNLRGRTASSSTFDGDGFDQARFEEKLTSARNQTMVCWYWIIKAKARFIFGDFHEAAKALQQAQPILWASHGRIQYLDYHFYSALLLTAEMVPGSLLPEPRERLSAHCRYLELWAESNPQTFADKHLLVAAEVARIEGRDLNAEQLYEKAITAAHENGFVHKEALANEVAAKYYSARGLETIANAYLQNARHCYLRWGALGKVRQLDERYPFLREAGATMPVFAPTIEQFDLAAVMRMSQAVSSEIVLERLIEKLLVIAVEHAGAVRGLLLLPHEGELRIEAEAVTQQEAVRVSLRHSKATSADLPETLLRYVTRSQERVVLDDAATQIPFSADEYVRRKHSRSVLCLPLVRQARVAGVLYLENDLASHVFTPPRIDMLQILASQAAISLENARLYHDLQYAEEKARLSERELRLAIDTIPALAWNSLVDGSNETFSKQWHDYTGISPADARSGGWHAAYHPDDVGKVIDKWSEMLAAGTTGGVEARIRRFDGKYRTFLVRGVPLRDESGAITKWYGTCTDIEDLKRAEMELRRSKVYLDNAEKLNRTGAVGLRVSDGKIIWSEEAARIYGYDPGTEATAERILQRVHPDDVALLTDVLSRAAQGGASFDFQHRLLMPDGTIKYLRSLAHPVKDEAGLEEILGAITDITEEYQAKAALEEALAKIKKSEDELRTTIDTIPGLVWTTLPEGAGEFFSQRWLDYTGLSTEEAQGDGWTVALHPDDKEMVFGVWTQMIATKKPGEVEARMRRSDGAYRWFLFRGAPLIDPGGNVVKWYGTNTDIEDFKRAEDELRRSQAFLAQAQRLTKTGSLWWKVATGQIIWSEESYRFLDYPLSVTPSVELIMQRCHPDDLDLVQRTVARSAQEGADMDFEHRLLMPDGSVKHIHVLVQNVGIEAGKPEFVGAVTDITERKLAEENLRKAHAELAHVTRVTTMGELAASIAHEVSQPIAGVVINGTACLRWLAGLTEDSTNLTEAREGLQRIIRDGKRAGDVIGRIRTLFKKAETVKEPLDLNEAIREVVVLTKSEMDKRRVMPRLELADELPAVIGDRVQLQQVMMNLILNALEAMSMVQERPRLLIVGTQVRDQSSVLITVRDTGPGLDSESMEKVFAAFHTTKPGGLGMGLSISRSIVENHSGRLWVTANDGPGVTFQFTLLATDVSADSQLRS